MAAEADDEASTQPSLEPPSLFGGRRRPAVPKDGPNEAPNRAPNEGPDEGDTRVFVDSGTDVSGSEAVDPVPDPATGAETPGAARGTKRIKRIQRPKGAKGTTTSPRLVLPRAVGAPVAGLLTGIALLFFVWLGQRGCDALRGTESCGTGPGLIALLVIFTLAVLIGRLLLGVLQAPEAALTSFLAVGLTSLVAVLLLEGLLDSPAILVILPILSAAAFAVSSWIATIQVDLDD